MVLARSGSGSDFPLSLFSFQGGADRKERKTSTSSVLRKNYKVRKVQRQKPDRKKRPPDSWPILLSHLNLLQAVLLPLQRRATLRVASDACSRKRLGTELHLGFVSRVTGGGAFVNDGGFFYGETAAKERDVSGCFVAEAEGSRGRMRRRKKGRSGIEGGEGNVPSFAAEEEEHGDVEQLNAEVDEIVLVLDRAESDRVDAREVVQVSAVAAEGRAGRERETYKALKV